MRCWVIFYPEVGNYLFLAGFYSDGTIRYYNGAYVSCGTYVINTWYHFKIEFDSTAQLFSVWIDEVLITGGDEPYVNTDGTDDIAKIKIGTDSGVGDMYVDAIGYSWDFEVRHDIYDFSNDTIGQEPIDWTESNYINCTSLIIAELDGNDKVLDLNDNNSIGRSMIYRTVNQTINSIFEFDIAKNDITVANSPMDIRLKEGSIVLAYIIPHQNDLLMADGGDYIYVKEDFIIINEFFRIKIELNDTNNCYDGYVNNILVADDFDYYNDVSSVISVDTIEFATAITEFNYSCYVDNINNTYIYNFYNIGDNLKVYSWFVETKLEVIRDEFAFDSDGLQYEIGSTQANGWIAETSFSDVYIDYDIDSYDRVFKMTQDTVHYRYLKKNYNILSGEINCTLGISYLDMNNDGSDYYWDIYSYDDTEIAMIRLRRTGGNINLEYYDDVPSWNTLMNIGLTETLNRELNIRINSTGCLLIYKDDNSVYEVFHFPKLATKEGLGKVWLIGYMNDEVATQTIKFDYAGAYKDGSGLGINTDYGISFYELDFPNWNFQEYNLVNIEGQGYFSIGVYSDDYFKSIGNFNNYSINSKMHNAYNQTFSLGNPYLTCMTNNLFSVSNIEISGVKLIEGLNNYTLDFTYDNVDIKENFFKVSENKLYFSQTSDDNNTEYIQATFNIADVNTGNISFTYQSILNGNSLGYIRINYTDDTSTLAPLRTYMAAPNIILPQGKTISHFIILITDNNNDVIQGTTSGYITHIKLIYLTDVSIVLITQVLLTIIIPLIILIIPTFLIYLRLGKNSIIPTFILMSFICFITNLIPVWLFFIILISGGGFMITSKRLEKD